MRFWHPLEAGTPPFFKMVKLLRMMINPIKIMVLRKPTYKKWWPRTSRVSFSVWQLHVFWDMQNRKPQLCVICRFCERIDLLMMDSNFKQLRVYANHIYCINHGISSHGIKPHLNFNSKRRTTQQKHCVILSRDIWTSHDSSVYRSNGCWADFQKHPEHHRSAAYWRWCHVPLRKNHWRSSENFSNLNC